MTLKRSDLIDAGADCECGMEHTNSVREEVVLQLLDEDYEAHHHPWRYWHTISDIRGYSLILTEDRSLREDPILGDCREDSF